MIQVLYIRVPAGGSREADITDVRWYDPQSGNTNVAARAAMVQFILGNGRAYVCNGQDIQDIEVAQENGQLFIRLSPSESGPDGLLSLPRF